MDGGYFSRQHPQTYMLQNIIINEDAVKDDKYKYMFSVEAVNQLVLQGTSFRDAYKEVGMQIQNGEFKAFEELAHTHEGSIGNLCNDKIAELMQQTLKDFQFEKIEQAIDKLLSPNLVLKDSKASK